jgi:hypothetical protein
MSTCSPSDNDFIVTQSPVADDDDAAVGLNAARGAVAFAAAIAAAMAVERAAAATSAVLSSRESVGSLCRSEATEARSIALLTCGTVANEDDDDDGNEGEDDNDERSGE